MTCRTAKHRLFSFLPAGYLPDAKVIAITLDAADRLAVLSSRGHGLWAERTGARLGMGDDLNYNHSECFGTFPFPDPNGAARDRLRALGEELDATRKTVQAEHPDLTLTGLYNVLEKVRVGADLTDAEVDVKDRGRVLILKESTRGEHPCDVGSGGQRREVPSVRKSEANQSVVRDNGAIEKDEDSVLRCFDSGDEARKAIEGRP